MRRILVAVSAVLLFFVAAYGLFEFTEDEASLIAQDRLGNKSITPPAIVDNEDIFAAFPGMEHAYEGVLPWEKDERFLKALARNKNPFLMAAFSATLPNPLPGETYNVEIAAKKLAGTVVAPGQIFSQNRTVGPYTRDRGFRPGPTYEGSKLVTTIGGGVCKVASVLYNVVIFCDLEIIMRYPHAMTVPYVPPGQDATVCFGVKDLRFRNTTGKPILIWAQKEGNTLYVGLYGFQKPPKVTWQHQVLKRYSYWKRYKYNPKLAPGEERVVVDGQEGLLVKSWVTVEKPDGEVVIKRRGTSFYSPGAEVVERARRF